MLQLNFNSIKELEPGKKWQTLFETHWDAYRNWFHSKGAFKSTSLKASQRALLKYMPKFYNTYEKLCKLAGNSEEAQQFLTGYNPPAYISGCSQLVYQDNPQLVRNYDYHPNLCEGTVILTKWHGRKVMAVGDCLWGAVDGMNDDGIAISLTFGGKKIAGSGFGIPFIIRYALEFSSTVEQAVEILISIPSHMAYNVAVMDSKGNHKMVILAPDKDPEVQGTSLSTNHQGKIDWPEHAAFSKTLEREKFLENLLVRENLSQEEIISEFLSTPLYNNRFSEGFGTIYTAVYRPQEKRMELRWKDNSLIQSFENFEEKQLLITYHDTLHVAPVYERPENVVTNQEEFDWSEYAYKLPESTSVNYFNIILENMKYLPNFDSATMVERLQNLSEEGKKRGEIHWEVMVDFWSEFGGSFR